MKLLIAGNLANTGFYLASALRKNHINVDLLMENNPETFNDPLTTGEIKGGKYPHWIKFWNWKKNWKIEIIKTMRKYDLLCVSTELPIFALFSFKPYIAIATGSDLNFLAQSNSVKGILLRLAYKRAKMVVYVLPTQIKNVKKLKLKNSVFIPLFRDFSKFKQKENNSSSESEMIIFHPTWQNWFIKKNYIFFEAFEKICKKFDNVSLIFINRGIDSKKSIDMIKKKGLEKKCKILPSTLEQDELKKYYQMSDIVVDQFGLGSFGFIGLEALTQGIPLVSYIEKDIYKNHYGEEPPVLGGNTSEEVYNAIVKLLSDKKFYNSVSLKNKSWMNKFHSEKVLLKKYIDLCKMVYEKQDSNDIINHIKFN